MQPSKSLIKTVLIVLLLSSGAASHSIALSDQTLYHIRYDVETVNGQLTGSRLTMIPAENEYRTEGFEMYRVTGKSDTPPEADIAASATNNAIKTLLIDHGLKSISSKHSLLNLVSTDKAILSYEGIMKHPCRIVHGKYLNGEERYAVTVEVWFSPVAFPDTWSYLYMKHTIKNFFSDMIPDL
jgi:hypothetical protein